MENIYGILVTISGMFLMFGIVFLIRWVNDVNMTGWRLRRWQDRSVLKSDRPWRLWFAWRPVQTVSGERVWWTTIYRQLGNAYSDQDDWSWYYYGTILDVLKQ